MKLKVFASALMLSMATAMQAQHLKFFDVPIEGDINHFTDNMKPKYKLKKRISGEYNIYYGSVCGHNFYMQANYTRKSNTVYMVKVQTQHIEPLIFLDSLQNHFGEAEETANGYRWIKPEGMIMYLLPEGYDPILQFIDAEGLKAYKEEQ